ncbi:MAG: EamA family transporter [Pseudomonas sp.]|uniref:EamA family transporter n=1 Tax=Pseudomonas abieticivorans TaxID=2931382 RepID=UPI0020C0190D|nr:EamA family transporter [Pseudomonas sp. PIA16]MDE1168247.1 EamA family transporter [Pseudomonas sp.]
MKMTHLLLALLIMIIWGLNFSITKVGLESINPLILAGIRFLLCALPAIFLVGLPRTLWRHVASYGLLFGVGVWGLVNLGISSGLSAGIASLVLQTSAFFSIAMGVWFCRESFNRVQLYGMLIAALGLASVLLIDDGSVTFDGLILVVVGAFALGAANIIIKKADTREVFNFLVWASLFAPLPLFALELLLNGTQGFTSLATQLDNAAITSILFQVYPNTLFAYWVWNTLLNQYSVSTVAPLTLLVPVFGMLGSILIFNEAITPDKVVAATLILLGLAVGLYGRWLRPTPGVINT